MIVIYAYQICFGYAGNVFALYSNAQVVSDTIKSVDLSEVVVTGSYRHAQEKRLP